MSGSGPVRLLDYMYCGRRVLVVGVIGAEAGFRFVLQVLSRNPRYLNATGKDTAFS